VAVALSFKSIGFVSGGPDAFIDVLLEVVGSDGTIMMNTFTRYFPISKISSDYVFDPASTPTWTGIVPTTLLKRKDAIRSGHPLCSVVAIGRLAKYLTNNHAEDSNALLPYDRLAQVGGKYLGIGIGNRLVAIRHEAQRRAGLFYVPFMYIGTRYKTITGETKLFIGPLFGCYRKLEKIVPQLERKGIIVRGSIGNAASFLANADELIKAMASIWKEDPTLTLCDDIFCLPCRDLERRMNLYPRIVKPKLFQENVFLIKLLNLRLKLASKQFSYISFNETSWMEKTIQNLLLKVAQKGTELFNKIKNH
jgi:aminoglycoside 3-N-acetyltransferase